MIKKYIKRLKYIDKILPYMWKDLVKVLIWQRRSWKSYIIFHIIDLLISQWIKEEEILYLNKEDLKRDSIRTYVELFDIAKWYRHIFIDEIQDIREREKAIRSLQSSWNHDIYITWSNSTMLSWELSTQLSWRYVSFEIYPLDYKEFLEFYKLEHNEKSFEIYVKLWWLPYLVNLQNSPDWWEQYIKDVVSTIILNDIVSRYQLRNIWFYRQLLQYLAKEVWHIFAAKNISDYLKSQFVTVSAHIVLEYVSHSTSWLFLHEAKRYDIKWKKQFEVKQKYFFTDIWIRHALAWWYQKSDISWILENIVFCNLISNWRKICIWEIWSKEIDFVATKWGKTIYVQVAYILENESTIQREFDALKDVKDNRPKYVISMNWEWWWVVDWVHRTSISNFVYQVCKNEL